MSLRILGGSAKGRALRIPESARPSGVRVRKSLFDLLLARTPPEQWPSLLDLHGGSGAIGLEAASRGYQVTLVERDHRALKALEHNARELGLKVRLRRGDALALLPQLGAFHIVFSDPPYPDQEAQARLPAFTLELLSSEVVCPGGLLICQHPSTLKLPVHPDYEQEVRRQGSNSLTLYWHGAEDSGQN